jgi:hypothetical protein
VLAACFGAAPVLAAGETTLVLSPPHAAAGRSAGVDLRSDCKLNYLNLTYTRYDGARKTATTLTDGAFDERLQKYRYTGRLAVPGDAAPGPASAFVQPYCGPPEEYPASDDVAFAVDRSVLALSVSPASVVAGRTVHVGGGDCAGPVTSVALRVRFPGGLLVNVTGTVRDRAVSASFEVPPSVPAGAGSVALARESACPGSRGVGTAAFRVRAAAVVTGTPSATPTHSATVSATPPAVPSETPSASATALPPAAPRGRGPGRPALVVALAFVAVAVAGGAVYLRRRA